MRTILKTIIMKEPKHQDCMRVFVRVQLSMNNLNKRKVRCRDAFLVKACRTHMFIQNEKTEEVSYHPTIR